MSNFKQIVIQPTEFGQYTKSSEGMVSLPQATSLLVRKREERYTSLTIFGNVIENDDVIPLLLASKETREEVETLTADLSLLDFVLKQLFGTTGRVKSSVPTYNSLTMLDAVNSAPQARDVSVNARLMYAAILNDLLDAFKMREDAQATSWIKDHGGAVEIKRAELVLEVIESSMSDQILHELRQFQKRIGEPPKQQFIIHSYSQHIYLALRNISHVLADVEYRATMLQDVVQLLGRMLLKDDSQQTIYGQLDKNTSLLALAECASLQRIALQSYDPTYTVGIPGHELKHEADAILRALPRLRSFELVHDGSSVVGMQTYRPRQDCSPSTISVIGRRRSNLDTHLYRVVKDVLSKYDLVDARNVTKQYGYRVPSLPGDLVDHLLRDNVTSAAELATSTNKGALTISIQSISRPLARDLASLYATVFVSFEDDEDVGSWKTPAGYLRTVFSTYDTQNRGKIFDTLGLSLISVEDPYIALALTVPANHEDISVIPKYTTEAVISQGKFFGTWPERVTVPAKELVIIVRDVIHNAGDVELPLLGEAKTLPSHLEVQATEGWADIVDYLNATVASLHLYKTEEIGLAATAVWRDQILTQLANWIHRSPSMQALQQRGLYEMVHEVASSQIEIDELHAKYNAVYRGMVSIQIILGLFDLMSTLAGGDSVDDAVASLLVDPAACARFGALLSTE